MTEEIPESSTTKEVVINKDESEKGMLSELKRLVTSVVTLLDPLPLFRTKSAIGAIANANIAVDT